MDLPPGLIVAAPASGCGKTVLTLGALRWFGRAGLDVRPAKVGPDYIDGAFHVAASGYRCVNLDPWGMRPETIAATAARAFAGADLVLAEGVMGLFDDGTGGPGVTAAIAIETGWPVVLVVDAARQAESTAALVGGFLRHRPDITIAGVIFNRLGGAAHGEMIRAACADLPVAIVGLVPESPALVWPERHLGLVQAGESARLERLMTAAADLLDRHADMAALRRLARPGPMPSAAPPYAPLPPLGQRIAVARDVAFGFAYEHVFEGWRSAGAEIMPFSPLADQAPDDGADAIYLPGGYPELFGGRLAANGGFLGGLGRAAESGTAIYGECGGYMILGEAITDPDGVRHAGAGLLPLETSFVPAATVLGYRQARLDAATPLGPAGAGFRGHEFHHASIVREDASSPLFDCASARGDLLGPMGSRRGNVFGSFVHLIDRAP